MNEDENNLQINVNGVTSININTESINKNQNREDKRVTISDGNGAEMRTSPMMFGNNREGAVLSDGTFVTAKNLRDALQQAIKSVTKGTVIVKKTGQKVNEEDINKLIDIVRREAGVIVVGESSNKVYNQDSAEWGVKDPNGKTINKGVAFLGNKGIYLESGEYISLSKLQDAVNEYLGIMVYEEKNLQSDDSEVGYVRERRNSNLYTVLPLILAINIASGFSITTVENKTVHVESSIDYETVGYTETEVTTEQTVVHNPDYSMGDEYPMEYGEDAYYDALLVPGTQIAMNESGFYTQDKYEGQYVITGFAICDKDGNVLLDYKEDFDEENIGYLLYDLEKKVHDEQGVAYEDMSIRFHLGSNRDNTRLGWILVNNADVIPYETIEEIIKNVTVVTYYTGVENNFDGEYITLSNGARIKVVDENGNLLPNGTGVKDEKGDYYEIRDLELTEETIVDSIETHKELSYSLNIPVLGASMLPLIAAILYDAKKRREAKKKNPEIYKFRDEAQKSSFVKDFENAKKEYEKKSWFGKMLKRIFLGSNYQVLQGLDPAQANELYTKIKNYFGPNYQIGPNDQVEFQSGKIFIRYQDGRRLDITEEAMKYIKDIGVDNPVDAKGMVDDEIHRGY